MKTEYALNLGRAAHQAMLDGAEPGEAIDFGQRSAAYLEACAAWRATERRMGSDWGLLAAFAGGLGCGLSPFLALALVDGAGPERAVHVAFAVLLTGVALVVAGLPFHFARRGKNPRPVFRSN